MKSVDDDPSPVTGNAAPSADADVPVAGTPWWVAFLAAAFVIVVAATFSYLMSRNNSDASPASESAYDDLMIDTFDRPSSLNGLGQNFTDLRGTWAIEAGTAFLFSPANESSFALMDTGTEDAQINALVGGEGVCGVTIRFTDESNYLALVRVKGFAVWNLIEVADGLERTIATLPDAPRANVGVSLEAGGTTITAMVGFERVTLRQPTSPAGTKVGLIATRDQTATCTWDDVVVRRAT